MLSNTCEFQEEKLQFQVIFLKNDTYQSVLIEEVDEINFSEIRRHLKDGESIFITSKLGNKLMTYKTNTAGREKAIVKKKKL